MIQPTIPPLPEIPNTEIRHVPSCPGYAVTDDGRAFSCIRRGRYPAFISTWVEVGSRNRPSGYIRISRGKKYPNVGLHDWVLLAFVGECPAGMEACHNDGDKSNNRLSNLRWDTRQGNINDRAIHGAVPLGELHYASVLNASDVHDIIALQRQGMTQRAIANKYGVSRGCIAGVIHGANWKHVARPAG